MHLGYVFDAVRMTKSALNDQVPLIGFAGGPWTLLCYAVQGQGSKNFDRAKAFCFQEPEMAKELLQRITTTTIAYLREKVKAGADVIQLFDSWGGLLSPVDYQEFSWPYLEQIVNALGDSVPVIVFGKGCWFALQQMSKSGASALGIDWTCSSRNARYLSGGQITLQGNFDPSRLLIRSSLVSSWLPLGSLLVPSCFETESLCPPQSACSVVMCWYACACSALVCGCTHV